MTSTKTAEVVLQSFLTGFQAPFPPRLIVQSSDPLSAVLGPRMQVTVQEWLGDDPGAEPQLRDASRGCYEEARFECSTEDDVRTCTATCRGELCNSFEDVAARVQQHEKEEEAREKEEEARRVREDEQRAQELEQKRKEDARKQESGKDSAARQTPPWIIPVGVVILWLW